VALDTAVRGPRLVGRYLLLALVAVLVLFPVYTMIVAALKPGASSLRDPLVPKDLTLQTLRDAWTQGHLGRYMLNSAVVAFLVTVAQLVTSVLAAYAFAFLQFPFKRAIFALFLATLLVPAEVTLLVNRRTVDSLGWLNSYRGLTVPFLATAFGIFLLRQVFLSLPPEMREAASMDGVGHLGFLREVAIPMTRPRPTVT
jgi:sn-glycerol 3-phosphate transport system permease protein